jgi:hypothetical protein
MSDINTAILKVLREIKANQELTLAQGGAKHQFIRKDEAPKKANKTKGGKVYPRVELPEGWKLIPGLNAIRTEGYNVAKAKSPKKDYGYWNREGLLRVEEALATM